MPETTLSWGSQADWDAAQQRAGVVSRDIAGSSHSGDTLRLGWDPQYGPLSNASLYWPLGDSTTTVSEELNGNDGTVNGADITSGVLGTNHHTFNANNSDYIAFSDVTQLSHSGSFTVAMLYRPDENPEWDWSLPLTAGVTDAGDWRLRDSATALDGRSLDVHVQPEDGSGSHQGRTHLGDINHGDLYHVVGVYDESSSEWRVHLNDVTDTDTVDTTRGVAAEDGAIGRWGTFDGQYFHGHLGHVSYWDYALSQGEASALYSALESGSLTTAAKPVDGEATELTTDASVPSGTSLTITVYQDTGSTTYSETVSVSGGSNTATLSSFVDVDGSDYWLDIDLENSSSEWQYTPTLDAATVGVSTGDETEAEPVGYIPVAVAGTTHDAPLYDHSDINAPGPHLTATNGNVGALKSVSAYLSSLQWSFDSVVYGAVIDEDGDYEFDGPVYGVGTYGVGIYGHDEDEDDEDELINAAYGEGAFGTGGYGSGED